MNESVAVLHAIDVRCGFLGDRIIVAQAHIEVDLCAHRVGAHAADAKCVPVRIAEAQMVHNQTQREAFDIDYLCVFSGLIHQRRVVITAETVLRKLQRTHAVVGAVGEKVVYHAEGIDDRIPPLESEVLHEAGVKRVREHGDVPAEKPLEILWPAEVIGVVEVHTTTGKLGGIHLAEQHERVGFLHRQ